MEAAFWHERWQRGEIGFHEAQPNALLTAFFERLTLPADSRVFLPLCGKTRDIPWLLSQGFRVAGAELSELAVTELFAGLGVDPEITEQGNLSRYSAEGLDIFVGDLFDLSAAQLGQVDAVYDRAALVALPPAMRPRYTKHLRTITGNAPQLLVVFEYDQDAMDGPPFSISDEELQRHYGTSHTLKLLESRSVAGGLKQQCPAEEKAWLLSAN